MPGVTRGTEYNSFDRLQIIKEPFRLGAAHKKRLARLRTRSGNIWEAQGHW